MNLKIVLAAAVLALPLTACKTEQKGSLRLASVSPDTAVLLQAGARVDFSAEIEYVLENFQGKTDLVVRQQNGAPVSISMDVLPYRKGAGKLTVSRSFTVPETRELTVSLLFCAGGRDGKSLVADTRIYRVAPAGTQAAVSAAARRD